MVPQPNWASLCLPPHLNARVNLVAQAPGSGPTPTRAPDRPSGVPTRPYCRAECLVLWAFQALR